MIDYFSLILVISLFSLGLRAITDKGMIGYPIRKVFQKKLPTAGKPIVLCSTCMSSVWGTVIYWGYIYFQGIEFKLSLVPIWIGVSISASFINAILWSLYENINKE